GVGRRQATPGAARRPVNVVEPPRRGSIRASAEDNAAHGGNGSRKRRNEENEGERRGGCQTEPGVAAALRAVWGSADRGDKQRWPSAAVCHHGRLIPTTPAVGRRCDPVLRSLRW